MQRLWGSLSNIRSLELTLFMSCFDIDSEILRSLRPLPHLVRCLLRISSVYAATIPASSAYAAASTTERGSPFC